MKISLLLRAICVLFGTGFPGVSISSQAPSHCPGKVPGLNSRIAAGALLVVPVRINGLGPYDFMVDTGSQLSVIDPQLAAQLGLKSHGTAGLIAIASYSKAPVSVLKSLEVGARVVTKTPVAIVGLGAIQAADSRIRGVLGESFLSHFDVLIDYGTGQASAMLCLDDDHILQRHIRGERIPFAPSKHPESEVQFCEAVVIAVRLPDIGSRKILLQLDSGSDGPILYQSHGDLEKELLWRAKPPKANVVGPSRAFAVLPEEELRIGSRTLRKVRFVTPVSTDREVPDRDEDGVLATVLFQRVYISYAGRFVVLSPRRF